MDILEIRLAYNVVQFVLLGTVRYGLFKDQLRLPLPWALVLVAAVTSTFSALWYFFWQDVIPFAFCRFFTIVLTFGLSCILIKAQFAKHALSYITTFTINTVLDSLSQFVPVLFPNTGIPNLDTLVLFVLLLVFLRPMYLMVRRVTILLSTLHNKRIWNYLSLCGFSVVLLCLTTTAQYVPNAELLASRIYLLLAMIGVYGAALHIQKGMQEAAETKAALEIANSQVKMQQNYYDNLVAQMEEIRHIRHDLRHHRAALMTIVKNGDREAAEEYIKSWEVLDESTPVTGNLVADSLLSYYCALAKEMGFALQAELSLSRLPAISDPDLCVLIGNLLSNALDAQTYLPAEQRYVRICARGDEHSFTLAVDNRFDGKLVQNEGRLLSRKKEEGHGIGISSVRAVCKKYNGVLQLEQSDDLFMAGVVIGL